MFIRILSETYVVNVVYQLAGSKLSLQMYQYQDDCLYMYIFSGHACAIESYLDINNIQEILANKMFVEMSLESTWRL